MEKNNKIGTGQLISDFIQRNRKPVLVSMGALALVFVGVLTTLFVMDVLQRRAISGLEELRERYHALHFDISEGTISGELQLLLNDLGSFAARNSGFLSGSAWAMAARIHSAMEDWPQAEAAWRYAAEAASRTYLGPLALFNAAVAAEKQGRITEAIELFSMSASHRESFPAAAHAQFSVGRLHETLNNRAGAIEAYRAVLARWPGASVWANLSQSRIIFLETERD